MLLLALPWTLYLGGRAPTAEDADQYFHWWMTWTAVGAVAKAN